jgi:anti-anti-sigma factor
VTKACEIARLAPAAREGERPGRPNPLGRRRRDGYGANVAERLSLDLERDGAAVVLRLAGELDEVTAPLLAGALAALVGERATLRLDLEGVRSIDRVGLELLLAAEADAALNGAGLEISGLQASLRRDRAAATWTKTGSEEAPA